MKISFLITFLLMFKTLMAAPVSPIKALEMVKKNQAIIIDVRETEELKAGMVKDAMILPLSLLNTDSFEEIVQTLPMDKTLILYCRSGRRAGVMVTELEKRGFPTLNMGSFDAWKKAGLPVTY